MQQLNTSEINELIKERIQKFDVSAENAYGRNYCQSS